MTLRFTEIYIFENSSKHLDGIFLTGKVKEPPGDEVNIIHFNPLTNVESHIGRFPFRWWASFVSLQGKFVDSRSLVLHLHCLTCTSICKARIYRECLFLPPPVPSKFSARFLFVDSLFFIGGTNSSEVNAFNVVKKGLWNVPSMSEVRSGTAVASSTSAIIVCGGRGSKEEYLSSCELFLPAQNR